MMSDRQWLTLVYKECERQCKQLQQQVMEQRQKLQSNTFDSDESLKKIDSTFRVRRTLSGHYGKIYAIQWSLSSETGLCSASQDGKLMIWNAHTENKRMCFPLRSAWVMTCAYSPSEVYVSCGGLDNKVSIYRISQTVLGYNEHKIEPFYELEQHEGYISCIRFWDDAHLISSSGDSTLLLWDIEKQKPISQFMDHTGDVMNVALCRERNVFVSVSCDNTAKIWDINSKDQCIGNFTGHKDDVNCCDWFPDGYAFGTGSDDQTAKLFDTRAYREIKTYSFRQNPNDNGATSGITSLRFSKSGKYLFCGYDNAPFLASWSTLSGAPTQYFPGLKHRVSCLDLNRSGRAFATGSWDYNVSIW
eukprot:CAMPEP_0202700112 /NCGR_PEP_ID=MMETSP1385-20130828/13327_1 /ASSEMBLY_ACC=CAM_ASM_000861 /TAXON_ID=933848 /ORGANISM="Elphidium margaritaceum" /LENGTH=359 /DNA_ID=CAMNT_0049357233 /DNA_START=26 /DNA_END=1102 /DNA_ORIENTATION=+